MQETAAAAAVSAAEFFARAQARLTLEVPPGLADPNVTPKRGDHDADPVMRKIAELRPIRPAAVLVGRHLHLLLAPRTDQRVEG